MSEECTSKSITLNIYNKRILTIIIFSKVSIIETDKPETTKIS